MRHARVVGAAAGAGMMLAVAILALAARSSSSVEGSGTRLYAPALASDGRVVYELPTPTPAATPRPPAAERCYRSRADEGGRFLLTPADADSVFLSCQVVAYYGHPGIPGLGVLGEASPDESAEGVKTMAAIYDDVNGARTTIGAFHIIAAVAQGSATADGSWLARIDDAVLREWLAAAERHDLLVILDIQMGHSTVDAELARVLPYLSDPRVHIALDPEWAMPPGVAPGTIIGGMDASEINRAQQIMSDYIRANRLSNRMLIVHQFVPEMIRSKEALTWYPDVDLVIDTDGFGYPAQKIANYNRYIAAEGAPHGGMKLFFLQDVGLMSPSEVAGLVPQPDLVIYQ